MSKNPRSFQIIDGNKNEIVEQIEASYAKASKNNDLFLAVIYHPTVNSIECLSAPDSQSLAKIKTTIDQTPNTKIVSILRTRYPLGDQFSAEEILSSTPPKEIAAILEKKLCLKFLDSAINQPKVHAPYNGIIARMKRMFNLYTKTHKSGFIYFFSNGKTSQIEHRPYYANCKTLNAEKEQKNSPFSIAAIMRADLPFDQQIEEASLIPEQLSLWSQWTSNPVDMVQADTAAYETKNGFSYVTNDSPKRSKPTGCVALVVSAP